MPLAPRAQWGTEGWAGSLFRASPDYILSRWPRKLSQQHYWYVMPPQKSQGYSLAPPPLHNPNRMQWTQETKIFPLPQQCVVLPARALCQATNCAVLNPSYFHSISCNCQRCIRCLTLIVEVWCCLFKSCTMWAEVYQFLASHCNENSCPITSANLHTNTLVNFKIKLKRLSGTACAFILDTIGT